MNKEEILGLINANQSCHLATCEGSQPHVRGMMCYKADESGIIFHTGNTKDLYKQIQSNPKVEICFFDQEKKTQVRVVGNAVIKDEIELKKEIVQARPFMKPWVDEKGYETLVVFQVTDCTAYVWTFETNFASKEPVKLT
ncbi:pyridoxamine 5'-phosphate oxidase family protein [Elusimicrobiota bacterium]